MVGGAQRRGRPLQHQLAVSDGDVLLHQLGRHVVGPRRSVGRRLLVTQLLLQRRLDLGLLLLAQRLVLGHVHALGHARGGAAGHHEQRGHGAAPQRPVHLGGAHEQRGEEAAPLRHRARHQHALVVHQLRLAGGRGQRQVVARRVLDQALPRQVMPQRAQPRDGQRVPHAPHGGQVVSHHQRVAAAVAHALTDGHGGAQRGKLDAHWRVRGRHHHGRVGQRACAGQPPHQRAHLGQRARRAGVHATHVCAQLPQDHVLRHLALARA
mmetsp:Transcript_38185/g.96663  ORF Transcript_38185/g.96663 Transcript_38185/m.96663 type:complete len:266 (+) Transcript_38185:817-1614(+)